MKADYTVYLENPLLLIDGDNRSMKADYTNKTRQSFFNSDGDNR